MLGIRWSVNRPVKVAALGAHCDDVEIGAGGLILDLAEHGHLARLDTIVFASTAERAAEAESCLADFAGPAPSSVVFGGLPDGRLPGRWDEVKDLLQGFAHEHADADLVLAPSPADAHQDHRLLGELVRTAFRDHLVLHYEIPKWDGDLGATRPTVRWPLTAAAVARKWALLDQHYASQRGHDWWRADTFSGLARLRGMECRQEFAEAFSAPALVLDSPTTTATPS